MSFLRAALAAVSLLFPARLWAQGADWMKAVKDSQPLSRLSIPGTHDAGALYEPLSGTTRCQALTLAEQLQAGVRFLDIRCRHVKNGFAIYHGAVDQKQSFDQVLKTLEEFLKAHPAEAIVMSVKEESSPIQPEGDFEGIFQSYMAKNPALWSLSPDLPELGAVRGKIVLFRRFKSSKIRGIDASVWPDSTTFSSGVLRVQDAYKVVKTEEKWDAVSKLLAESATAPAKTLFVNFTSGFVSRMGIPSIPAASDDINPRLDAYLKERQGCTGILVMDFATAARCEAIYRRNGERD